MVTYGAAENKNKRDAFKGLSYNKRSLKQFDVCNSESSMLFKGLWPKSWIKESKQTSLCKPAGVLCYLDLLLEM